MYTFVGDGYMNASFRGVNEKLFKEFKAEVSREGLNLGLAVNEAFRVWLEQRKKVKIKKMHSLFDIKSWDWGFGSERTSQEVDKVLYG